MCLCNLQVREAVGGLICKLGSNLQRSSSEGQIRVMSLEHSKVKDWTKLLVEGAKSAAATIQTKGLILEKSSIDSTSSETSKEALKRIETVS